MRILLLISLLLAGCASSQNAQDRPQRSSRGGYMLTADDIEASGFMSLTELLVARVPGVRRSPDGNGVLLRGAPSVNASNEPLFVIDGVPTPSGVEHVRMMDIATIEVLSGSSKTADYGMLGVNGVILVKTKDR